MNKRHDFTAHAAFADIVSALSGGEKNGFEIIQQLFSVGNSYFSDKEGELYVLLHSMQSEKLLKSRERKDADFRRRRYYRLTAKGRSYINSERTNAAAADAQPRYTYTAAVGTRIHAEKFFQWCSEAASQVVTSPDKEDVIRELTEHMEDRYNYLIGQGSSPAQAESETLSVMGSASECAVQLGAVHPPFWGKAYHTTRKIATVMLVVVILCVGFFVIDQVYVKPDPKKFDPDKGPAISGTSRCIYTQDYNSSVRYDGYTVTLDLAALWQNSYKDEEPTQLFNARLLTKGFGIWTETPAFSEWIWARDSLGNIYYSSIEDTTSNALSVSVADYKTGAFEYTHDIWIYDFSPNGAEWLELVYDRSGRNMVFRIELSGGVS